MIATSVASSGAAAPPGERANEDAPGKRIASIKSLVVTLAFLFLLVVAMLLDIPYLYIMAIALALLQPVSYHLAARFAPTYTATRSHPPTAVEGKPVALRTRLTSRGGMPQSGVAVVDVLPDALRALDAPDKPMDWWNGREGERSFTVEPLVRGVHRIESVRVDGSDPLGLFFFDADLPCVSELVVHPTPLAGFERGAWGGGPVGVRERDGAARRGDGLEFHGVRDYRPGDSPRRVHWRTSAKRGRLAVVEFEKAFRQDLLVAIDLGPECAVGSGRETPLEHAIKAAATLVDRTLSQGGGVVLATAQGSARIQSGRADTEVQRFRLFDLLARLRPGNDSLADVLRGLPMENDTDWVVLTSRGDDAVSAVIADRVRGGQRVRVMFFEPASFGGVPSPSPAVRGAELVVFDRADSPWEGGGKRFDALLGGGAG